MRILGSGAVLLSLGLGGAALADEGADSAMPAEDAVTTAAVDAPAPADEPATRAPSAPSSRLTEEIVVTAQKREENLQDVPISVAAFSADQLDARGIEEPRSLQLATPGMQYNIVASYTLIYIRGVGTDAFIPSSDASVATYIDGIYYPMGFGLAAALGSIERVEVLKGPQGTLFGRNTTGGAINIITKQPSDEFLTEVQASRESYDKTNLRIFSSIPLADDLAVSFSGLHYDEDTFYDKASDNPRAEPFPQETSRAAQAKLRWRPGDLDVTVGSSYVNSKGSYGTMSPVGEVRPLGVALGVHREPDYEFGGDTPNYTDTTTKVLTLDAKYALPWFDTRLIGGRQKVQALGLIDYDGSTQPLLNFEGIGQFADVKTAELQFLSKDEGWGADWLKWIGGVYYLKSSAGYDPLLFSAGAQVLQYLRNPPQGSVLEGITAPLAGGLDAISAITGVPVDSYLTRGLTLNLQGVLDTESIAYFAQGTADLTDTLALTVGGRFQDEKRKLAKSTTRVANPDDPFEYVPLFDFGQRKKSFTNFSPKATLDWKLADDQMVYGTWARGFKSGTFNIIGIYTPTQYVKPERVTSIEAGYKGTLLDGSLRFNASAFQNKIENLQVQTISLTSGGAVAFETAGAARIRGVEFDLLWEIAPNVVPGLVLTGAGSYLDGVYTDYQNGSGFDEQTGLFFAGQGGVIGGGVTPGRDFTGNRTVRTPKWSGNGGLSYTIHFENSSIEIAGDAYYNSGSYFAAQNSASSKQDAYTVANARISYFYEPWDLRVTAFGKNVNDEKYYASIQEVDLGTWKLLAAPATYGLRVQWNF